MNLRTLDDGSQIAEDDPGEPTTNARRISITKEEGELLGMLAMGKRVIELGTGLGVSTQHIARTALRVHTVDPDPWVHEHVWPHLPANVQVSQVPLWWSSGFDMVFIDADHETEPTIADIDYAHEVCTRGVIVVHDAKMATVRDALDHFGTFGIVSTHFGMGIEFVGWDH